MPLRVDLASTTPKRGAVKVADVPHMAKRYDSSNPLPPSEVAARSNKVFRWRCNAGPDHEYEAMATSVYTAKRGGCPYCSGRKPSVTNRLDVRYPDLAAEWDAELNDGPPEIIATSEKKAWWRCRKCEHIWQANIRNRTVLGAGCPKCAARKISAARSRPVAGQALTEVAPDVATTWHPTKNGDLRPEEVAAQSNKPRWWLCKQGHEWEIPPAGRIAKGGNGCPYCSGRLATAETSLAAQHPDIAAEWHPTKNGELMPEKVKPATGQSVWWLCPNGHEYRSRIANRTQLGRKCPYCSGQKVGYGNDLATRAPDVASEWDHEKNGTTRPEDVTTGVQRKFWWRCAQGHSWKTTVASRVGMGTGCPQCGSGWRRSRPEIGLQYELGHVLPAPVAGDAEVRVLRNIWRVDVLCLELRLIVEFDGSYWHGASWDRDLKKTRALSDDGWIIVRVRQAPLPMVGPLDVRCEKESPDAYRMTLRVLHSIICGAESAPAGHPARAALDALRARVAEYEAAGIAQAAAEAESAVAAGRVNRPRQTTPGPPPPPKAGQSLAEKSPKVAAEWHPTKNGALTAWDVANARNATAWWLCSLCGKAWEAAINGRVRRQNIGCPDCARLRAGAQRAKPVAGRSLADLHPDIAAQWHPAKNGDVRPHDVKPGSHKVVWWIGSCFHEWKTAIENRTAGRGCPRCAKARRLNGRISGPVGT